MELCHSAGLLCEQYLRLHRANRVRRVTGGVLTTVPGVSRPLLEKRAGAEKIEANNVLNSLLALPPCSW